MPIKHINKTVKKVIRSNTASSTNIVTGDEGPLWYRGLAFNNKEKELAPLKEMLAYYDADSIVIAHTPTPGTVIPRFGGRVFMIDVGIAKHYGSRRANLVIEEDVPYVVHRGRKIALPANTSALKDYLKQSSLLDPPPSPLLKTIKKLESESGN
jgi:hypothetical protein